MVNFDFYSPVKIHFGSGNRKNAGELSKMYGKKCLIVRTSIKEAPREKYFSEVTDSLENAAIEYVVFDQVEPNPTKEIVEQGRKIARLEEVSFILGYGGGSSLDTAKAIALLAKNEHLSLNDCFFELSDPFVDKNKTLQSLPIVTITTTSGTGSQVTQAAVISDMAQNEKMTIFHSSLFPKVSIIDPELMLTVPKKVTSATGFDALCHAIESYFNPRVSRLSETMSLHSIGIIVDTLPKLVNDLENVTYRQEMAYADTLSGMCLSNAGAEAPHPIGEMINGFYPELYHGETLAFVYPTYFKHVFHSVPEKVKTLFTIFTAYMPQDSGMSDEEKAFNMMKNFLHAIDLPGDLASIDLKKDRIEKIKSKLCFNLPLTDSKQLQQIFESSVKIQGK